MKIEVEQAEASEMTITARVVCQPADDEKSLFNAVSRAIQEICGRSGSLSLHMNTVPLYRRPKEDLMPLPGDRVRAEAEAEPDAG